MGKKTNIITKLLMAGISFTSIGYFLYENITRQQTDTHIYVPYYVEPSVEQCNTAAYNPTSPPTYALLNQSYSQQRPDIEFVKANCTVGTLFYNKQQQICDLYAKKSEFWVNIIDQRKVQLITNCIAYGILTLVMLINVLTDFCRIDFLHSLFKCSQNQQQNQQKRFLTFFLFDCFISPCTILMACKIRDECLQYMLTINGNTFMITQGYYIGLVVFMFGQLFVAVCLVWVLVKDGAGAGGGGCRGMICLLFLGCVGFDCVLMIVATLGEPVWLIVITGVKMLVEFVGIYVRSRNLRNGENQGKVQGPTPGPGQQLSNANII